MLMSVLVATSQVCTTLPSSVSRLMLPLPRCTASPKLMASVAAGATSVAPLPGDMVVTTGACVSTAWGAARLATLTTPAALATAPDLSVRPMLPSRLASGDTRTT